MNDPKTAPDPQNGTHQELLELALRHITECDTLRSRLYECEETVRRQSGTLQSLERQLCDLGHRADPYHLSSLSQDLLRLAKEAHDGYTD